MSSNSASNALPTNGAMSQSTHVPLEAVISTAQLYARPPRHPDPAAENRALVALAKDLVGAPSAILHRLVQTALELCRAGSCGVSIIEDDGGAGIFRWHALVGALSGHLWGTTPRNFSPCGTVVDTNALQLMSNIGCHFTYFNDVKPAILEALLVPFAIGGKTVGTIWVVMHDPNSHFDAEDARVLSNLGEFAAAAYQVKTSLQQISDDHRRKDEFLATLAHELRNPLSAIHAANHYLNARLAKLGHVDLHQAAILQQRQLAAMNRMIDDLMDVSRLTRNKLEIRKQPLNLTALLEEVIADMRDSIKKAGLELHITLPVEPIMIDGDETRLTQVLANLLHNATKFTPAGGSIFVTATMEDEHSAIVIRDTGVGIPSAMLSKIFEPFAQGEPARESANGGLGIGLSLVRHLTTLHDGTVSVKSGGAGQGSEFTVRLPRRIETVDQGAPPAAALSEGGDATVSLRVLVVDDNHDAADSMKLMLAQEGHDVQVCYEGGAALAMAAQFRPQVLLQDISMPGISGLEIARRLRASEDTRSIVLIALSGFGQEKDLQRSSEAGFAHHLVKPVALDRILELLGDVAKSGAAVSVI
jgi:signal transduction histidine kinase/ActR/RegA family two-component response regulator